LGVVYRPIVELSLAYYLWAEARYEPMLAESWGFSDDNMAYEVRLRADAKWSNGDPVTADDVITTFNVQRILGASVQLFGALESIEKVDDQTVRFNFSKEPSYLIERQILKENIVATANYGSLAQQAADIVAAGSTKDSDDWKALNAAITEFRPEELIASGPYTYTLDDVGDAFMTLRWQPNSIFSNSVKFGELKLWAGETEATAPLVLSGELAHSTNVYPPATIASFQEAGVRLITTPRGYGPSLLFNHAVAPFDKKEVRQAIAYAINREQSAFLTNGLGASGTVYFSGILDSLTPTLLSQETLDALNKYEFNLDMAAELMTAAGFTRNDAGKWADAEGNTITVEYTFPADFADFSAAAQDATSQLNDFGFDISLRALPWQEARDAIYKGDFQLSVWSWGAGSPFAFQNFNNPTRRFNGVALAEGQPGIAFPLQFDWNGAAVDLNDLILTASDGLDEAALTAKADQVALIINDVLPFIPLNEMLSVEPVNEQFIAGAPADGDPIYNNPSNDHWVILMLLNGTLMPGGM
jgi:peptide/nickel transport system substrate-binding protein